jgi:hypothetical protein
MVRLSGEVERRSVIALLVRTVAAVPSVVAVEDAGLRFRYDDLPHLAGPPSWVGGTDG